MCAGRSRVSFFTVNPYQRIKYLMISLFLTCSVARFTFCLSFGVWFALRTVSRLRLYWILALVRDTYFTLVFRFVLLLWASLAGGLAIWLINTSFSTFFFTYCDSIWLHAAGAIWTKAMRAELVECDYNNFVFASAKSCRQGLLIYKYDVVGLNSCCHLHLATVFRV